VIAAPCALQKLASNTLAAFMVAAMWVVLKDRF
jgi:hypothetical protein